MKKKEEEEEEKKKPVGISWMDYFNCFDSAREENISLRICAIFYVGESDSFALKPRPRCAVLEVLTRYR